MSLSQIQESLGGGAFQLSTMENEHQKALIWKGQTEHKKWTL